MADVTVKQFAEVVGIEVDRLLEQLEEAGVSVKGAEATITDDEKMELLGFLRNKHSSDDKKSDGKRISLKRKTTSELKTKSASGKSKAVVVEVRKKRTYVKRTEVEDKEQEELETARDSRAKFDAEKEEEAALAKRNIEELEAKKREEDEGRQRAQEEVRLAEEEKLNAEKETVKKAEKTQQAETKPAKQAEAAKADARPSRGRTKAAKPGAAAHTRYGRNELHVAGEKAGKRKHKPSKAKSRRQIKSETTDEHGFQKPTAPIVREVNIGETITVSELASRMSVKAAEVIKVMMNMGSMVTINQVLDQDTASVVVEEMGHSVMLVSENAVEETISIEETGDLVSRAAVVTIMGHVDHGKTSLLDYIRESKVTAGEAGGITQHIGAYHVETKNGFITFLDTPGHEAFTAMRARGAKVTDIVIIVVAADDGVMPQTREAIQHAKAAEVPMIIAVNKIDKENADPDRVKNELAQEEVIPEDWGGDVQFINVSAITGEGVESLLEAISLQAEVLELKATVEGPAQGVVIESRLDKGRGPVATVLIQRGSLYKGNILLAGLEYGRVRALISDNGAALESAGPSIPVEVLGLSGTPSAGDDASVVPNERKAREVAIFRQSRSRDLKLARQQASKMENMFNQMQEGEVSVVNIVLKADVQGSVEAINDALLKLSTDEVKVKIVSSGVGGITESDVNLAMASSAIVIGFNVRADTVAKRMIDDEELELNYYSVIYDLIDEVRAAMSGMLSPEIREQIVGLAEVRDVFRSPKFGDIAGCMVTEGAVKRNNPIRVLRDNVVIYEGELESLRRFKDDVAEVKLGTECGIGVKNYNDVKAGDQIEVFERIEVKREL